jgi:hypothetical protein
VFIYEFYRLLGDSETKWTILRALSVGSVYHILCTIMTALGSPCFMIIWVIVHVVDLLVFKLLREFCSASSLFIQYLMVPHSVSIYNTAAADMKNLEAFHRKSHQRILIQSSNLNVNS